MLVSEGWGRLFRRADDKYLIYLPKDLCEDSMFPFRGVTSLKVKVSFKVGDKDRLTVERLKAQNREG